MATTGNRRLLLTLATLTAVLLVLLTGATLLDLDGLLRGDTSPDVPGSAEAEAEGTLGTGDDARRRGARRVRGGSRGAGEGSSGEAEGDEGSMHVAPPAPDETNDTGDEAVEGSADEGEDDAASDDDAPPGRHRVRGRIRVPEGAPSPSGARVLVAVPGYWEGTRVGENGTFHADLDEDLLERAGGRVEVRVRGEGYRLTIVPFDVHSADEVVIELEPQPEPPAFGTVRLLATDADGRVHQGDVLLTTYDSMGDHHGRLVRADAAGAADLLGLEPGTWSIGAVGGGRRTSVHVPPGGVARAQVVVGDWPGTLTEEEFRERQAELAEQIERGRIDRDGVATEKDDRTAMRFVQQQQTLEQRWRTLRPQVELRLTITEFVPDEDDLIRLRATWGPGVAHVLPLGDGTVTTAISPEVWAVSLLRDGREFQLGSIDLTTDDPLRTAETDDQPTTADRTLTAPDGARATAADGHPR